MFFYQIEIEWYFESIYLLFLKLEPVNPSRNIGKKAHTEIYQLLQKYLW